MTNKSDSHWKRATIELRDAGLYQGEAASKNTIVTVAGAHTNAHRCNNRVQQISDQLDSNVRTRGGQALVVGAPAVSDLAIDDIEMSARMEVIASSPVELLVPAGSVFRKCARHVWSAHYGCVQ